MTFYPCYALMLIPNHTHSATHKVRSLWNTAVSLVGSPHSSGPNQVICTHSFSLSSLYLPFLILPAFSHSLQMSCLVDQVSDTPTPHTSLWLFLHTLDIISPNLCKEPRDSCVSCHPLLLPYLRTFRDVFVPVHHGQAGKLKKQWMCPFPLLDRGQWCQPVVWPWPLHCVPT